MIFQQCQVGNFCFVNIEAHTNPSREQDDEQEDVDCSNRPFLSGRNQASDSGKKSPQQTPDSPTASTTLELSTSQLAKTVAEARNAISAGSIFENIPIMRILSARGFACSDLPLLMESSQLSQPKRTFIPRPSPSSGSTTMLSFVKK